MEMNSFGEDLAVKTRKPYTITKQREKWTEEEHSRFLEALKLYGRAWQRIEEHIGTKTAIQIRSHAQKFFTKLEKEAFATGSTRSGQAHDIDIPPPRPKKKPNYPYPRKTGFCSIPLATEAAEEKTLKTMNPPLPQPHATNKQDLRLENNLMQEASVAAKSLQETKESSDEGHCSVVLNLFQDAPSASFPPSMDRSSKNQFGFREYVPMATRPKEPPSLKGSSLTIEVNMESTLNGMTESDEALGRRTSEISIELPASSLASSGKGETSGAQKQAKKQSESGHEQGDGSNLKETVENGGSPSCASPLMNHTIPAAPAVHSSSAMSYIPHPFPTFPPFAQFPSTRDFNRSLLGISSTFSTQIVSTLLQNPAVHAAACMAAAIWPSEEMDSSSMEAIAAATVAAASAWWATNGLVPFFPPIHASGFAFSPPATSCPVLMNTSQAPQEKMEERHETYLNSSSPDQQIGCPERLKALETPNSTSKSLISSSSSSDLEKFKKEISNFNNLKPLSDDAYHNLDDKAKISKQERSSCGSNTTSSSEIETGAVLKKNGETNDDEVKQAQFQNLPAGEVNTRHARSSLCFNETWKEVSQEGRLAFQALFTRDILPQSFTAQFAKSEMGLPKEGMPSGRDEASQNCSLPNEIKLGNLKVRRTGFKPYKRCSAEVEVSKSSGNDETGNKKIRLQGEALS